MPFGFHDGQAACGPQLMEAPSCDQWRADVTAIMNNYSGNVCDRGAGGEELRSILEKAVVRPVVRYEGCESQALYFVKALVDRRPIRVKLDVCRFPIVPGAGRL